MSCAYKQYGCSVLLKRVQMQEHHKTCIYRTISCLIHGCNEICSIDAYPDHLKLKHRRKKPYVIFRSSYEACLRINFMELFGKRRLQPHEQNLTFQRYYILEYNSHTFLVEICCKQSLQELFKETATLQLSTRFLSAGQEAPDYRVFIKVYNSEKV